MKRIAQETWHKKIHPPGTSKVPIQRLIRENQVPNVILTTPVEHGKQKAPF